jgi:hypothetical protein
MDTTMRRWIATGGLAFVALLVLATVVFVPPGTHDAAASVASAYADHKNAVAFVAYLVAAAILVGVFYFWYLRDLICAVDSTRRLATIGFAGALLFLAAGGLYAGIYWASYDLVGYAPASTLQLLNTLQEDTTWFLFDPGAAVFLLATGAALVRSGVLAKWLGWLGVVGAVASIGLPVVVGPIAAGVWILVASIVMLVHNPTGRAAAATLSTS